MTLREKLATQVLIGDGAMGTVLNTFGVGHCHEELNLTQPDTIQAVHKAYIEAGVDIIQTNTYSANALKLARYGLEKEVDQLNVAAVELAIAARTDHEVYILGTIGGIHNPGDKLLNLVTHAEILSAFSEQLNSLLLAGVDGILLETYYDMEELKTVLTYARKKTKLPIIANVTMQEQGVVANGQSLNSMLHELAEIGADAVGANCFFGPHYMAKSFEHVSTIPNKTLVVYPNASALGIVEGEMTYQKSCEYFGEYAELFRQQGIGLIGGCCGTTPDHIRAMKHHLLTRELVNKKAEGISEQDANYTQRRSKDSERLSEKVRRTPAVIVELAPPRTLKTASFISAAKKLTEAGVDKITISDNSLAQPRISNLALASVLTNNHGIRPLIHLTTRDHNLIGLSAHLMGLHTLQLFDILAITGDPAKIGDFPGATSVFDVSSAELIQMIQKFNKAQSYTGKNLREASDFCVGAACNPNVMHIEQAARAAKKKQDAGADYLVTQPIFSIEKAKNLKRALSEFKVTIPVFIGIQPIVSRRNAEFLHNEIPGIHLTEEIRTRMLHAEKDGCERAEGLTIAKELIDGIKPYFNGFYLVTPFMLASITAELTTYIKTK